MKVTLNTITPSPLAGSWRIEKVVISEIEIGLSFMVPEHVYQLKMICLKGT
jgi:hypothetical protein